MTLARIESGTATAADQGTGPVPVSSGGNRLPLLTACAATFLAILDAAVVNMAYGPIAADLHAAPHALSWIVSGYAISFAAYLAVAGRLADLLGHRRVLVVGVVGFGVASGVCAWAPTLAVLIGARVAQGLGAALILPAALGALLAGTPDPRRRAAAIGAWSASGALAAAIGPAVGALVLDAGGWRWIFWLNLPICALVAATACALPRLAGREQGWPDLFGALMFSVGVAAIVAAATEGRQWPLVPAALVAGVGVLAVVAVVRRSRGHPRPALEVAMLRRPGFAASSLVSFLLGFGLFVYLLDVPLLLTGVWRLSLLAAAGCIGAAGTAAMIAAAVAGRWMTVSNARWAAFLGMTVVAAGHALLASPAFGMSRSLPAWSVAAALLGVGIGVSITAVSVVTASVAESEEYSAVFGLNLTARQLGGATGIAVLVAIDSLDGGFLSGFHAVFAVAATASLAAAVVAVAGFGGAGRYSLSAGEQAEGGRG
ncbi:MFS transporter [Nocardia takedensis]|uniref:MFS transporter n=1 Tax=Nocardia takedensis TaxID=259390 RepID=UPI003F75D607